MIIAWIDSDKVEQNYIVGVTSPSGGSCDALRGLSGLQVGFVYRAIHPLA